MPFSLGTKIPVRVEEVWGIKLNKGEVNIVCWCPNATYSLCAVVGKATVVDPGTFYLVQFTPLLFSWGSVKYPYMTK